jgi:hypothetical protein
MEGILIKNRNWLIIYKEEFGDECELTYFMVDKEDSLVLDCLAKHIEGVRVKFMLSGGYAKLIK